MQCWHTLIIQGTQALVLLVGVGGCGGTSSSSFSRTGVQSQTFWLHLKFCILFWPLNSSDCLDQRKAISPLGLPPPEVGGRVSFCTLEFYHGSFARDMGQDFLFLTILPLQCSCSVLSPGALPPLQSSAAGRRCLQKELPFSFSSLLGCHLPHKNLVNQKDSGLLTYISVIRRRETYKGGREVPIYPWTSSHVLSNDECVYLFTLLMLRESFQMSVFVLLSLGHMDSLYLFVGLPKARRTILCFCHLNKRCVTLK